MESVIHYFSTIGIDFWSFLKLAGILLLGALLLSALNRFIFRKQTILGYSVSSSIAIIFIYVVMILILTFVEELRFLVTPLPFATISQDSIRFFSFEGASYTRIAGELLSLLILSFLVNLVNTWMPQKKNIFTWTFFRILTVAIGLLLHFAFTWVLNHYLPAGILEYAPVILLAILILMLLTGALRFLVGLLLTSVNPLIAALYTFFFATLVGKQLTKAAFTTGILAGVVLLLEDLGITTLSLASSAMIAYIPFLLILIAVWYVINRL